MLKDNFWELYSFSLHIRNNPSQDFERLLTVKLHRKNLPLTNAINDIFNLKPPIVSERGKEVLLKKIWDEWAVGMIYFLQDHLHCFSPSEWKTINQKFPIDHEDRREREKWAKWMRSTLELCFGYMTLADVSDLHGRIYEHHVDWWKDLMIEAKTLEFRSVLENRAVTTTTFLKNISHHHSALKGSEAKDEKSKNPANKEKEPVLYELYEQALLFVGKNWDFEDKYWEPYRKALHEWIKSLKYPGKGKGYFALETEGDKVFMKLEGRRRKQAFPPVSPPKRIDRGGRKPQKI